MALKTMVWDFDSTVTLAQLATNVKDVAIAAGWELASPTMASSGNITASGGYASWAVAKDFSGGSYTDETAYVQIYAIRSGSTIYVALRTYETWNSGAHTGTGMISASEFSNGLVFTYQLSRTLMVSAGDKHLWIGMKSPSGAWETNSQVVLGATRESFDTVDLNTVSIAKSVRVFHLRTVSSAILYSVRTGGVAGETVYSHPLPTAGLSEWINKVILHPITGLASGAHPSTAAQTSYYRFKIAPALKYLLAEGAGQFDTAVKGMQFPDTTDPEYMVFLSGLAIQWCTPNVTGS